MAMNEGHCDVESQRDLRPKNHAGVSYVGMKLAIGGCNIIGMARGGIYSKSDLNTGSCIGGRTHPS